MPSRLHARQMAAAISDAMPTGDVHSTTLTILPMTALNVCGSSAVPHQQRHNLFSSALLARCSRWTR